MLHTKEARTDITMKSFIQHTFINEKYTASNVVGLSTQDLGIIYRWLKWGNAAKTGVTKNDPDWARQRDVIGSELGKRARTGKEDAKRALNNRSTNRVDKYGKTVSVDDKKKDPPSSLLKRLLKPFVVSKKGRKKRTHRPLPSPKDVSKPKTDYNDPLSYRGM